MRRQIDELKRKAEQGSQKMQGEILELELEEVLKEEKKYSLHSEGHSIPLPISKIEIEESKLYP